MATEIKELAPAQTVSTLAEVVFTATRTTLVSAINVNNSGLSDATFTAYLVQIGESVGAYNQVATNVRVPPSENNQVPAVTNQVMEIGTSLYMVASAPGALTVRVSGVEFSDD